MPQNKFYTSEAGTPCVVIKKRSSTNVISVGYYKLYNIVARVLVVLCGGLRRAARAPRWAPPRCARSADFLQPKLKFRFYVQSTNLIGGMLIDVGEIKWGFD